MTERIETVIVGGGPAGLAMSYYLSQLEHEHVVLERGRVAERWRSERWDSLTLQFPNWMMLCLPGDDRRDQDPDGFLPKDKVVDYVESYAASFGAPVRTGVQVRALRPTPRSNRLNVETDHGTFEAAHVIVATGQHQRPALPGWSCAVPTDIVQMHSSRYRNSAQLPLGSVLVVGTGASGAEIAEELCEAGRVVYLSVGRHFPAPRRYRGKDYAFWRTAQGWFERTADTLVSPEAARMGGPLLTGVRGGHDLSLQDLATAGVILLGRLRGIRDRTLDVASDLEESLGKGDRWRADFTRSVDEYVEANGLDAPEDDRPLRPAPLPPARRTFGELNLNAVGITSVVWATGFSYEFNWIELPIFGADGDPVHRRGVTAVPGVYFLGLRWLHKLKSSFLHGLGEDAAYLAEHITVGR